MTEDELILSISNLLSNLKEYYVRKLIWDNISLQLKKELEKNMTLQESLRAKRRIIYIRPAIWRSQNAILVYKTISNAYNSLKDRFLGSSEHQKKMMDLIIVYLDDICRSEIKRMEEKKEPRRGKKQSNITDHG